MVHDGTLKGLWIVRTNDTLPAGTPVMARVQEELYVLAFTNAPKADACTRQLGAAGKPFYVCTANIVSVEQELRQSGACGFIIDYDATLATFTAAHGLTIEQSPDAR